MTLILSRYLLNSPKSTSTFVKPFCFSICVILSVIYPWAIPFNVIFIPSSLNLISFLSIDIMKTKDIHNILELSTYLKLMS